MTTTFFALKGGNGGAAVGGANLQLIEKHLNLVNFTVVAGSVGQFVGGSIVAADNLVFGGFAAHLVVADAETHHVDAHVGGRFIGILAIDAFKQCVEHGVDFDIAVVVDGHLAIGIQMEGVDHIDIVEVGGGSLISHVDGMFQWETPYGEGLKFGVAGMHTALVLAIELAEADGHLTTSGTGGGDDDQWTFGLDKLVLAKAIVGGDESHIVRIALNQVVDIGFDAHPLKPLAIDIGGLLTCVVGDDHRTNHESSFLEFGAQSQHVLIVGDAKVGAHLVFLDVLGADDNHNLNTVA